MTPPGSAPQDSRAAGAPRSIGKPARVAVFASGSGTTLQALLDHAQAHPSAWRVELVVTDRERPGAVERAEAAGVPWVRIPVRGRDTADVERETLEALAKAEIDVVALAGYLRLIPSGVVARYEDRMLNTHPSLLPAFSGQGMYGHHVHQAVVESGVRISGPTIHMVDKEYDRGRPLAQWPVPVLEGDTASLIAERVQAVERSLYPLVVDHLIAALRSGRPVEPYPTTGDSFTLNLSDPPSS